MVSQAFYTDLMKLNLFTYTCTLMLVLLLLLYMYMKIIYFIVDKILLTTSGHQLHKLIIFISQFR